MRLTQAFKFPSRSMRAARALIAAGLLLPAAAGAQGLPVDRDKAWFKPLLVQNHASVCADLLKVEQEAFFSTAATANHERAGFKLIRKMYEQPVADPQVELVPDSFGQLILTLPGQQRVVAYFHYVDGSSWEGEQVLLSNKVFDPVPSRGHDLPATPFVRRWTLYKSAEGEFYALGYDDGNLKAYRAAPSLQMELACEVQLGSSGDVSKADASIQGARQAMQAFMAALSAMSQGAGNCGTLNAHETRAQSGAAASHQVLFRPWASWAGRNGTDRLINDTDNLSEVGSATEQYLRRWALSGVAERRAFIQYQQQYALTAADLSTFYRRQFGWSETQADDAAGWALQWVLEHAFAFSSSPARLRPDQLLRQAILEHQSMAEIDEAYKHHMRNKTTLSERQASEYDGMLNAAIEYPEALQYLLRKGLDPNETNGFGKTALMYAAQYDQVESARILLAAGADPNAATFIPEDDCFYTLRTSGVTPLHYAVRYASAPMIQLLVSNGAATFNKMRWHDSETEATALDWLNSYQGFTSSPLHELLRVPDDQEREKISANFLTRAQEEYARGEFKPAYLHLRVALSAQPGNAKVQADWPLMAFKAGYISDALRAAEAAIESTAAPQLQASAWFNMGLICESSDIRSRYYSGVKCNRDWIWPFVQAWKLQPTRGRADRLVQLFARKDAGSCAPAGQPNDRKLLSMSAGLYDWDRVERFYILHAAGERMKLEPSMTTVIDALPLADQAITVLEAPTGSAPPRINGEPCRVAPAAR